MIGIYCIKNLVNNKLYIGSAVNMERRKQDHYKNLRGNKHCNKKLQNAWNKHGEFNFVFEIVEEVQDKNLLLEREQYWLDYYQSYKKEIGYNIRIKAESNLGVKFGEEMRRKVSLAVKKRGKGFKHSEETKKKLSECAKGKYAGSNNPNYGKHHSQETINKIKEKRSKQVFSKESLKKRSQSMKGKMSGEKNPMYGYHYTEEEKKQKSEDMKGVFSGEKSYNAKLSWEIVRKIREEYKVGDITQKQLARKYGVSASNIMRIINNYMWKE